MNGFWNNHRSAFANLSRLELSTEHFLLPDAAESGDASVSSTASSYRTSFLDRSHSPVIEPLDDGGTNLFRREVWVPPLLVLSTLTMVLILLFEVFVLCKTWRTVPSRRHLFLGQMLLLGLFVCSSVSAVLTAEPSAATCAVVRVGSGLGYSLIFSTLLVKMVFLISLNGGVYLPAPYQALLLFFAVAIQIAIDVQWLINSPPKVIQTATNQPSCQTPYVHTLYSLSYVVLLMVVVTCLALKSRSIRDNYREAMFIAIALCSVVPIWACWVVSGLMALEKNRDACLAFGLSITSIVVFLVMFMPKGRQLAAMGREGMYVEDKDDQVSSVSRASPSFYHFKPSKQAYSTSTKMKHGMNTFGDRVALVAPPPTYAHHFYPPPCCYYPQSHLRSHLPPGMAYEPSMYTTLEPTMSSNPNVFFHRGGVHPGMMY